MALPLQEFKILIADPHQHLALVSKQMLQGMGFSDIHYTNSGRQALSRVKKGEVDFLITDWHLKDMDGIALINHIRRDPDSPNPAMPIIMLTNRMEQADVVKARDHGIHEYVVKPFSAQTIYDRLQSVVEFPRKFIVGQEFTGPDRRRRNLFPVAQDRRRKPMLHPLNAEAAAHAESTARVELPDLAAKHKLGIEAGLDLVITPALLGQSQAAIDAITEDSLQWIKQDLAALKSLCRRLRQAAPPEKLTADFCQAASAVQLHAEASGYARASEVAHMLYLFCHTHLQLGNTQHRLVVEKHVEVMHLIFGAHIRDEKGSILQLIKALKTLGNKYAA